MLEFGAGVSTLAFAHLLHRLHGGSGVRLFSLEQNEWAATAARARLQKAGLEAVARVFFAPLEKSEIEGVRCLCYSPNEDARRELEESASRIEWILVDGPAGDDLVRFSTLPLARPFAAPGAHWFLDDARRDEERAVLNRWVQLADVKVEGTFAVGKGLACGRLGAS